jgi:thiamine-phosphate pyrophosphorylase
VSAVQALRLIAITDCERFGDQALLERWERLAASAVPGSTAVDLRERSLAGRALLSLGQRLADVAARFGQLLIVNDRLDVAALLSADGVHLGENAVETARARDLLTSPSAFVVRACHEPLRVDDVDADIVLLSPILAERKGNPALGLTALRAAADALRATRDAPKLFALGGVDAEGAARCLAAGAQGVAAIASAFAEATPLPLLRALGIERRPPT